jgi:SNF family Na+-dependent transporter
MIERLQQLRRFPPPTIDASFAAGVIPWLMALLTIGVVLAVVDFFLRRTRWLSAVPNAAGDRAHDRTRTSRLDIW